MAISRHGRADWILRTRMVRHSWDGLSVATIAAEWLCSAKTMRIHFSRFNEQGSGVLLHAIQKKYIQLQAIETANPTGDVYIITDKLASHGALFEQLPSVMQK